MRSTGSAVGPAIHTCDRLADDCIKRFCPSVRPSYTATEETTFQIFPFAFNSLFCYSGRSQIVQMMTWALYLPQYYHSISALSHCNTFYCAWLRWASANIFILIPVESHSDIPIRRHVANLYSVSPKNPQCGFLTFSHKRLGIFNRSFLH